MSTSTNAILLYGIPLEEGAIEDYDEENLEEDDEESGPSYMAFMGNSENGVIIEDHCSDESPMHFVAIKGSVIKAHRGYPKKIDPYKLVTIKDDWDEKLNDFVKKYNLPTNGKAGWYVASYWG